MNVVINGTPREIAAGTTARQLIVELTGSGRGSALVLDGTVLPRTEWDAPLPAGASVELITAVQGG
jgi:sulfur carrier protein